MMEYLSRKMEPNLLGEASFNDLNFPHFYDIVYNKWGNLILLQSNG